MNETHPRVRNCIRTHSQRQPRNYRLKKVPLPQKVSRGDRPRRVNNKRKGGRNALAAAAPEKRRPRQSLQAAAAARARLLEAAVWARLLEAVAAVRAIVGAMVEA